MENSVSEHLSLGLFPEEEVSSEGGLMTGNLSDFVNTEGKCVIMLD